MRSEKPSIIMSKKIETNIRKACFDVSEEQKNDPNYKAATCIECGELYFRHKNVKEGRCCLCRRINREVVHGGACVVQPGYPKKEAFTEIEELEAYFSHEKITCLLCGNEYKNLGSHVGRIHEVEIEAYKLQFGLPLSRGLQGTETHQKLVENGTIMGKRNMESGAVDFALLLEKSKAAPKRDYTHAPALKKKQLAATAHILNSEYAKERCAKYSTLVAAYCSKCGGKIERGVTEQTVMTRGCNLFCSKCRAASHKESQEKWAKKKGIDLKEMRKAASRKSYLKKKNKSLGG